MRKNLSNFTLLMTLMVILCSGLPARGIDYKITKVVEIGPAAEGFMSWPLRWSPDGKWLAYFHNLRKVFQKKTIVKSIKDSYLFIKAGTSDRIFMETVGGPKEFYNSILGGFGSSDCNTNRE